MGSHPVTFTSPAHGRRDLPCPCISRRDNFELSLNGKTAARPAGNVKAYFACSR